MKLHTVFTCISAYVHTHLLAIHTNMRAEQIFIYVHLHETPVIITCKDQTRYNKNKFLSYRPLLTRLFNFSHLSTVTSAAWPQTLPIVRQILIRNTEQPRLVFETGPGIGHLLGSCFVQKHIFMYRTRTYLWRLQAVLPQVRCFRRSELVS